MSKRSIVMLAAIVASSAFAGELMVVDGKQVETHYAVVDHPDRLFEYNANFPYGLDFDRLDVRTSKISGCQWAISHERRFAVILHQCENPGLADEPHYKVEKARAVGVLNGCADKFDQLSVENYQCIYAGLGIL